MKRVVWLLVLCMMLTSVLAAQAEEASGAADAPVEEGIAAEGEAASQQMEEQVRAVASPYIMQGWAKGGFLDQLIPYGVTKGDDGYPLLDGKALYGVIDSQNGFQQMTVDLNYVVVDDPDAVYARTVLDAEGNLTGLETVSLEDFETFDYDASQWETGWLAPLKDFGVTPDENNMPVYEGEPVAYLYDEHNMQIIENGTFNEETGDWVPLESGKYLVAEYELVGVREVSREEMMEITGIADMGEEQTLNDGDMAWVAQQEARQTEYAQLGYDGTYYDGKVVLGLLELEYMPSVFTASGELIDVPDDEFYEYTYIMASRDADGKLVSLDEVDFATFVEKGRLESMVRTESE